MMTKTPSRTPKNYDGVGCTNRQVKELVPDFLARVHQHVRNNSALVLASWPTIIGPQLASMTQAMAFNEGVLEVKVNNSTLYSLLVRHDKPKLFKKFRAQFPNLQLKDIVFRIG